MRRYMVDPDNEDRLLKIPPHVVAAIKAEALDAAWVAVGNVGVATTTHGDDWRDRDPALVKRDALAAIDSLKEKP